MNRKPSKDRGSTEPSIGSSGTPPPKSNTKSKQKEEPKRNSALLGQHFNSAPMPPDPDGYGTKKRPKLWDVDIGAISGGVSTMSRMNTLFCAVLFGFLLKTWLQ